MTIPTVTPGPAAPDPATDAPATFSTKAAAFVLWLKDLALELVATIAAMNDAVDQVNSDAGTATTAASTATAKAAEAAASSASAVNAPGTNATSTTSAAIPTSLPATFSITVQPGKAYLNQYLRASVTGSPANYVEGEIASYNSATGALVLNVRQSQGVGTYAAWDVSLAAPRMVTVNNAIVTKSAAFMAVAADIGRMFECTGTWTLGLDAAATAGDGWYVYVSNVGTGTITIDPFGSETIQDYTSIQLMPGDSFLVACDGASFKARKLGGNQTIILTSGTSWRPPYDCIAEVMVIGGGSGSTTSSTSTPDNKFGRGAAGAMKTLSLKRSVAYTTSIGAGGTAGAAGSTTVGGEGGTTSFSGSGITTITAPGGKPTNVFTVVTGTGGDFNFSSNTDSSSSIGRKGPLPGFDGSTYGDGGPTQSMGAAGTPGYPGVIIIKL